MDQRAQIGTHYGPPFRGDGSENRVAIIGLAGRFPGAQSVRDFWRALECGETGLTHLPGCPDDVVGVRFALENKDCFDAAFFGFAPSEAALMDPQHRCFWKQPGTRWKMPDMVPVMIVW